MHQIRKAFFFALILSATVSCQTKSEAIIIRVNKSVFEEDVLGKNVQLIDVRTSEEYEAGHIDDAVNYNIIDSDTFLAQIENLDKEQPVYLYCKMGGRSNRAAELLKKKGFKKIFDYSGGYNDWLGK